MLSILKICLTKDKFTQNIEEWYDDQVLEIGNKIKKKLKKLGKGSLHIREIDAGSNNDCEHEIIALENPIYDISRYGLKTVASPRHADILMVTGPVVPGMEEALKKTYEACPEPKIVIAVGFGAITGRISENSTNQFKKVADCIPIDIEIMGDPPSPLKIFCGIHQVLDEK